MSAADRDPDLNRRARFTHLDSVKVQEVRRQRHGDRTASIRDQWMEFSPAYLSLYCQWDPGVIVRSHGHYSDHVMFVIEGDMMCGDRYCPAGTHIAVDKGQALGPFIAGPNGTKLIEVMMGDPRSFPGDNDAYLELMEERGVVQLPDPPIDMPPWLKDMRDN